MDKFNVGFLGAGGIARSHVFALESLKYYYPDPPEFELVAVCSATEESRKMFADKYNFHNAVPASEFFRQDNIDTVFILGPNSVHYSHLESALGMPGVRRIYLEKPVCSSKDEEEKIAILLRSAGSGIKIQVGFQFLLGSAVREAIRFWQQSDFGRPVHFSFTLKHSDYLNQSYRDKRRTRLTPAPDGGAMADLGSHALSMMVAFMGENLQITSALQAGEFEDVTAGSDLYSEISLYDPKTSAVGNASGSRISSGIGDMLAFEIFAEKGALKYNSFYPDRFEYFFEDKGDWCTRFTGSSFKPVTSFPSGHVPGGWLRALIHSHYVFMTGNDKLAYIPDLQHGLEVQRLVRESAEAMVRFRGGYHRK